MEQGGNGNGRDDDEKTQPNFLVTIYDVYEELLKQNDILEIFDKKLKSLETSINLVMDSYTNHNIRITEIESTCEGRGKVLSRLLIDTPIPK